MAVRSDYRIVGMSTAEVKQLQRDLGVTVDGAWGKQSQSALERYYGANADPLMVYKGSGSTTGKGGAGASSSVQQYGQPLYQTIPATITLARTATTIRVMVLSYETTAFIIRKAQRLAPTACM